MKAMILAAGRGERLRPLTDSCPKPLLSIAGKSIIERMIVSLVENGFTELIINLSWKADLIRQTLGDGKQFGASLSYSDEGSEALETAGGILKALPFFEDQPFLVVNGDVYTDYPYATLLGQLVDHAHLVLVANPQHHSQGDFGLAGNQVVGQAEQMLTFSGIGVYHRRLFERVLPGRQPLGPLLRASIAHGKVTGEYYPGAWMDIGTVQRYQAVNRYLEH